MRPLYNPATPSEATTVEIPLKVLLKGGGIVVWARTLMASKGQRNMSATNSAEAEPAR